MNLVSIGIGDSTAVRPGPGVFFDSRETGKWIEGGDCSNILLILPAIGSLR